MTEPRHAQYEAFARAFEAHARNSASIATEHPEIHEHLSENPGFIAFRLRST